MFEDRKKLFVDVLGWSVPVVGGRFEQDRYDGGDAIYLIALDDRGDHAGSMRLLPTTSPHILSDLFPDLCAGVVPTGPAIFEITRLCLPTRHVAAARLDIRNRLISAMVDYALCNGIEGLTGVVEASFLLKVLAMGWNCRPLGSVQRKARQTLGAFQIDITPETPGLLALRGIYTHGAIGANQFARQAA
jgi:acyl-homoserine lactone synthase